MSGAATLTLAGRDIPLTVRRSRQARRLTLTADPARGEIRLTLPHRASQRAAERFLVSRMDWLAARAAGFPAPRPFLPGARVPFLGEEVEICWREDWPRTPRAGDGAILLGGPAEMVPARLTRWLRAEAKRLLSADCAELAANAGLPLPAAVTVRDTRRQWGSCAHDGRLSFSWRLVLAPPFVRRSVAAHELAHLVHRNHAPAFHREAARILGGPHAPANRWLRENGAALHWVGRQQDLRPA